MHHRSLRSVSQCPQLVMMLMTITAGDMLSGYLRILSRLSVCSLLKCLEVVALWAVVIQDNDASISGSPFYTQVESGAT